MLATLGMTRAGCEPATLWTTGAGFRTGVAAAGAAGTGGGGADRTGGAKVRGRSATLFWMRCPARRALRVIEEITAMTTMIAQTSPPKS